MSETRKQPTCEERVSASRDSRIDDLRRLIGANPDVGDFFNNTEGSPVCSDCLTVEEESAAVEADSENEDSPITCVECGKDRADEDGGIDGLGSFHEYGLAFDYVPMETFKDMDEPYFRFQISCGGPSEEFRFYCGPELKPHRIEFWYLDWFDGAGKTLHGSDRSTLDDVWEQFAQCGCPENAIKEATE